MNHHHHSHHRTGSFAELTGGAGSGSGIQRPGPAARRIAAAAAQQKIGQTQSDGDLQGIDNNAKAEATEAPISKKLSKINLRKLKIW